MATLVDHTPRGHAARYISQCYTGMRDDTARTDAYRRAIEEAAPGRVVVDLGTGALALLAIFAAEAGAAHVYAIEVQAAVAESARRAVQAAGLSDRITVLHGFSTDAALKLPAKGELVIHELIGEVAGEEGVVAAIADAARRHLQPGAQPPLSVPARARSLVAPCEHPDEAYRARQPAALLAAPGGARALKLPALPDACRLAPAQPFEDLRFEHAAPTASQACELRFVAARAGRLCGLAIHVELHCGAGAGDGAADVSSAWPGSHWSTVVLLLDDELAVGAGQALRVRTTAELAGPQPLYTFQVLLEADGGELQPLRPPLMTYPEAALNCNEFMDAEADRYAS